MHAVINGTFRLILDYVITAVEMVGALIILTYVARALLKLLKR